MPVSHVTLSLPLTFDAEALLEVFVVRSADASCEALAEEAVNVDTIKLADRRQAAARLNEEGAAIEVAFDELPAEIPLAFFARVVGGSPRAILAHACQSGVRIEAGGQVEIELRVAEATSP